jgi:hypothetical protein
MLLADWRVGMNTRKRTVLVAGKVRWLVLLAAALMVMGLAHPADAQETDGRKGRYILVVKSKGKVVDRAVGSSPSLEASLGDMPAGGMCRGPITTRLTYNDFFHDIYTIKMYGIVWCGNGTGGLASVTWGGRGFEVHEYGWSWVGWRGSEKSGIHSTSTSGWASWWIKGQFHHSLAQVDGYPRYKTIVYSNATRGLWYRVSEGQAY